MDCTMGSKARESFVQVVVGYAQTMAERMYEEIKEANPGLEGMEKGVLTELPGFGKAMLSALMGMRSEKYPVTTIACGCGAEAHYQRKRSGQCKTLLGTIALKRAYYLCPHCHQGSCPLDKQLGFCAGSISAGLDELLALLGCQFSFAHRWKW